MQGETKRSIICSISLPFLAGILMASLKIRIRSIGSLAVEVAREMVVEEEEEDESAFSAIESSVTCHLVFLCIGFKEVDLVSSYLVILDEYIIIIVLITLRII